MFEKFTEGAIKVIMVAQEEARRMGHNFVGTEQLLLGLIGQRNGIAAKALKKLKVTLRKTRKEIQLYIGRGSGFVSSEIPFTPRAKRVLEMALIEGRDIGQNYVGTEHLLLALLSETDGVATRTLDKMMVNIPRLKGLVYEAIEERQEKMGKKKTLNQTERYMLARKSQRSITPTLDLYSQNISQQAIEGVLDPVIGREKEINDVTAILSRRGKNNPVLLGEPGVGKTAVTEGLAIIIIKQSGPDFLDGSVVIGLDLGSVLAGTKYRGEFEERLKRILDEVQEAKEIILVIDEVHTLVGAGAAEGAVDAANILKPALARGRFRCVGATTKDEYSKYIERDKALTRRFQPVIVEEPHVGTAIEICLGLKGKFESHHNLIYDRVAVEQAVILADRYIADRFLPDKAIDVLDEAGGRVRLENKRLPEGLKDLLSELTETLEEKENFVRANKFDKAREKLDKELELRTHIRIFKKTVIANVDQGIVRPELDKVVENDVAKVVANWTGIPVNKMSGEESQKLLKMEKTLRGRVIGQKHAIKSVTASIKRARVGFRNPNRPIASFIFAGPTGVGKTELTKALTDFLFENKNSFIRLDMSEYMEKHTTAKLIGSPPGYVGYNEGGLLTEAVRKTPYSVVLFDEVEKAHPDVFNLLLQILDDGRLSDSQGKVIDFTNTVIIMTTNLGSDVIQDQSGLTNNKNKEVDDESKFNSDLKLLVKDTLYRTWDPVPEKESPTRVIRKTAFLVKEKLKTFFRPEFLNRIDEIIIFNHLAKKDIWDISDIMIKELIERVKSKNISLTIEEQVRSLLVDEGYDPLYGARPLRRTVMTFLEDRLAETCLSKEFREGTRINIKRKTLETLKTELAEKNEYDELRFLLDNSPIRLFSDDESESTKMVKLTYMYSEYNNDLENINVMYKNPFGAEDYDTYTNLLDIEIFEPKEREFNEHPERKSLYAPDSEETKRKNKKPLGDEEWNAEVRSWDF